MRKVKVLVLGVSAVFCMSMLTACGKGIDGKIKRYAKCADVKDYKGVEYVPASREVTQEDIDGAIQSFCDDNSETIEDTKSSIADGDLVNISYVETISGSEHDSNEDYMITIGEDNLGDGFDENLIGVTPGTSKTIKVSYPADYSDTEVAGMDAEFDVTVNYISVTNVPEYTDELVKNATGGEYTTTSDYTEYLTNNLQEEANDSADEADRTSVLKTIVDKTEYEKYPENEAQEYVEAVLDNISSAAGNYGIDMQTYLMYFYGYSTEPEFLEFLTETVESVMQEKIVVCSIAVKENIIATDEDARNYKNNLMEENGIEDEAEIDEYYTSEDILFYATEEKVLDYLMESAVQVESTEEASTEAESIE
ncbi:MAG: FKBP-type peptidyl-prolyl cis-trans isomerase [Coprococcus sp.]